MSVSLTLRIPKGSPLTNAEVDGNFTALNEGKLDIAGGTLTGALQGTSAQFTGNISTATPTVDGHVTTKAYVDGAVVGRLSSAAGRITVADATGNLSSLGEGQFTRLTASSTGATPRFVSTNTTIARSYSIGTTGQGTFTIRDETAGADRATLSATGALTIPGETVLGSDPTGSEPFRIGVNARASGYLSVRDNSADGDVRLTSVAGGSVEWRVGGSQRWAFRTELNASTLVLRDTTNGRTHVTFNQGSSTLAASTAFASSVGVAGTLVVGNDIGGPDSLRVTGGVSVQGNFTAKAGGLVSVRSLTSDPIVWGQLTPDTNPRFSINASGAINWGTGSAAPDANLYRTGVNQLSTDGKLVVGIEPGGAEQLRVGGSARIAGQLNVVGSAEMVRLTETVANGHSYMGWYDSSGSRKAYFGIPSPGATNIALVNLVAGGAVQMVAPNGVIVGSTDTGGQELLRVSAGLRVACSPTAMFYVVGTNVNQYTINTHVPGDTYSRWAVGAGGTLAWGPGNAAADLNLYRQSAGILRTDNNLQVAGQISANLIVAGTDTGGPYNVRSSGSIYATQSLATAGRFDVIGVGQTIPTATLTAAGLGLGTGTGQPDCFITRTAAGQLRSNVSMWYGVNDPGTSARLRVDGDITCSGVVNAFGSSDISLKENIAPIQGALAKLQQVNGVEFDWTDEYLEARGGVDGRYVRKHDIGVIAQEVQAIAPEIVAEREDGTLAVRYEKMAPLFIEALKELAAENKALRARLDALEARG